jgi:hypothetical protein
MLALMTMIALTLWIILFSSDRREADGFGD